MIDLNTYEEVKLEDVAEYARAKKGKVYPVGTSTIQISATRGQIGYLTEPRDIETKHVAIVPQAGINPKYFNIVMQKNVEEFSRWASSLFSCITARRKMQSLRRLVIQKFKNRLHSKK